MTQLFPQPSADTLLARRAVLGPAYRHFYDEPLRPVRGSDVWLYDAEGRSYLDCYNNVPSVGHSHPRIVEALAKQAALLNTHTRYLHESTVQYAERLVALFPPELDTVMFTCTGSEANDLALRIVYDVTGNRGLIVSENAYHGVTASLADMSPSLQPTAPHVRVVPAPNTYRASDGEDVAARFGLDVQRAIASLRESGHEPAALMVDTVFASDGIFPIANGVLTAGAREIRAAGGLFIADEVQGGFGRTGHWWAMEREAGFVPDMVSLGKPMGAGHPVAGLVLKARLATPFGQRRRYFNTFGGNTVSAAVGMAVLDVIDEQALVSNAKDVGAYLAGQLRDLAVRHECIGDVRGAGLYIGLELVEDRTSRTPATRLSAVLVNRLRHDGILLSTSGPAYNVLKIRPPLTFSVEHANRLVGALDEALQRSAFQGENHTHRSAP